MVFKLEGKNRQIFGIGQLEALIEQQITLHKIDLASNYVQPAHEQLTKKMVTNQCLLYVAAQTILESIGEDIRDYTALSYPNKLEDQNAATHFDIVVRLDHPSSMAIVDISS